MRDLSHVDEHGKAHMVDVGDKPDTMREARARGAVVMQPSTLELIQRNALRKGDVLVVAKIAGILAAKRTSELIPLCHPLPLTSVDLTFRLDLDAGRIDIESVARDIGVGPDDEQHPGSSRGGADYGPRAGDAAGA